MDKKGTLDPVIEIDLEKCNNCYACVTACPVKYCIDGSGEKLTINHDLCIGCGHCIHVCTHGARKPIDDTKRFMENLKAGEKIIAIVAPAAASVFPGSYLNLNGYLKSLGVAAFFDVSFGAELTVFSYLNHIKKKKPRTLIAQPCPAIVSYIQIYHPALLPYLAPAHSPMLHTVKMIREYYPDYKNCRIAVISPCIAKKREFAETGLVDYNVTMLALRELFEQQHINLRSYPAVDYIGAPAERAVSFSSPGGLLDTAERFSPGIRRKTRKIEGVHTVYQYLAGVNSLLNKPDVELPQLIDCLNCELGCNGGPGTGNHNKNLDELESPIRKRSAALEKRINPKEQEQQFKKYHKVLSDFWKPELYSRSYKDLSGNYTVKQPSEAELTGIYKSLRKNNKADLYDCTACGYGTCKSMATAIYNKLNRPDKCAHYNLELLEEEQKTTVYINQQLKEHINITMRLIDGITTILQDLSESIETQSRAVEESSKKTETMVHSLKDTSEMSRSKQEAIKELMENASLGQASMRETIQSVQGISQSVDGIASAIKIISAIAANTNLLSMNAAIEAAHAGESGRGFAVVADEIRRLSESTRENSRGIAQTLKSIIDGIAVTSKQTGDTNSCIAEMSGEINDFAQTMTTLLNTFNELSIESSDIITALDSVKLQSNEVKSVYAEMLTMTDKLRDSMHELTTIAKSKEAV